MKTKIEIQDHGVMLNDYFGGTSGVWLNISIDNKTTVGQIIEQLESEINMVWDHIEYTAEYNDFSGNLEAEINMELQKIKEENKNKLDMIHKPDLDFDFNTETQDNLDCLEYPVLILTIEFLED
jgi:hypothetical protein